MNINLHVCELGEDGRAGDPVLLESGAQAFVLQALDRFLLTAQPGQTFDITIEVVR